MASHRLGSRLVSLLIAALLVITTNSNLTTCEALSSTVLDRARIAKMQKGDEKRPHVAFSHVHLYVDHLKDLSVYKDLEDRLNSFVKECDAPLGNEIPQQKKLWESVHQPDHFISKQDDSSFVPQNRDLVQQLLSGFGFRVTGARYATNTDAPSNTRSVLVTSKDPSGVQFLLTAKDQEAPAEKNDSYHHFDAGETMPLCSIAIPILCSHHCPNTICVCFGRVFGSVLSVPCRSSWNCSPSILGGRRGDYQRALRETPPQLVGGHVGLSRGSSKDFGSICLLR